MALRLEDRWIWDLWLAREGDAHHLFFLQAPRALGDPELRHAHATVGHAVSVDLRSWELLPDALAAGPAGAWDDRAIWTGSVLHHAGRWWMFYTGTSLEERGLIQRIGSAVSDDLIRWERTGDRPCIEADPRHYELYDPATPSWYEQAWRDPWVFFEPSDASFHALITARCASGPPAERGVIGHAVSDDLAEWRVEPPLHRPDGFGHLEVPQRIVRGDRALLLFSAMGTERVAGDGEAPHGGTFYCRGRGPLGPFERAARELCVDAAGSRYAGRLVEHAGRWWLLCWLQRDVNTGAFLGEISDPVEVDLDELVS